MVSSISFYPGDNAHSRAKGELIWEYRAQRFSSQAANDQSRLITPGNMLQDAQEELIAKSGSINPFNVDFNSGNKKTSEKINGAMLKVIVDFNRKKDKHRSVINFYSDRESDPRGQASSGGITDLSNKLSQLSDNASGGTGKTSEKINGGTDEYGDDNSSFSISPEADEELELVRGNSECGMRNAELEILQAFPKHKSFQAKEILKSIADKDLKNIETGIDAKINTTQYNKMTSNAAVINEEYILLS